MDRDSLPTIVVVDDEEAVLTSVRRTLRAAGYEDILICADPRNVLPLLDAGPVSLILLDLMMPHMSGRELLGRIAEAHPDIPVIIVTAEQGAMIAVECMKAGAYDYLLKPVRAEELVATVRRTLDHRELSDENALLRSKLLTQELARPDAFESIITSDPAMLRVFAYLEAIAKGTHPALITGETGTGKELIAKALHKVSGRRGEFIAVNVAGLDDTMFSDTLFGHRPGAFTGASTARRGMAELAGQGTLFLDEIGDLAPSSQVKLLRLLQEREYYPLGAETPKRLDARVIAATHRDPSALRSDLFYRLRAYHVRIPALRERLEDLPQLVTSFVREAAADLHRKAPQVPDKLYRYLSQHDFPGNIRELRAMVFDAVARHSSGPLSIEPFLEAMHVPATGAEENGDGAIRSSLAKGSIIPDDDWREMEKINLLNALSKAHWRVSGKGGAADLLGIRPSTLESRMKSLAIERPR
jgi:two-component system, NtrC family, nitrogen regulation response regulator GlnG